jgi:transcriptional regulator with XRE-family HTH domain
MEDAMDPVRAVAQRVADLRRRKGINATKLGELLGEQGLQWDRFTVANLESGRRRNVTIPELFALAAALDVPPLALLIPETGRVQVTSKKALDPVAMAAWMDGTRRPGGFLTALFTREARRLREYREVTTAIAASKGAYTMASQARGTEDEKAASERLDVELGRLARVLEPLLRDGVVPGPLPLGWLTMMAARGYLDADLVPADEARQLEEWENDGEQEHQKETER